MRKLQKIFATLLTVSMAMSLLSIGAFAEEPEGTDTEETTVDPYIYYYNGYDVNVSPHYVKDRNSTFIDKWLMIFRLDTENYRSEGGSYIHNGHTGYNEEDRVLDGFPAYCSDVDTGLNKEVPYKRINLEDSTYYDDATAAKIRGVLKYGYWPDDSWDLDAAQTAANGWLKQKGITVEGSGTDPETGEKILVQAEITGLTNAEALTATQAAIWNYSNSARDFVYDTTWNSEELEGNCESTTVDRETVDYTESASGTTENNINLFIQYLMGQEAAKPEKVLFSDEHFVTSDAAFTGTGVGDTTYTVSLRFKLSGTIGADDDLTLTAQLGDRAAITKKLTGTGALKPESDGYYLLTFENVTAEEAEKGISMKVSGYQKVDGVYFYEPKPASNGTTARKTSQNLVGKVKGSTPVSAEEKIAFQLGTKSVELTKYNGDKTLESAGDGTVEVAGKYYPVLPNAVFDLYAKVGDEYVLVESGLKTDENGRIVLTGLADNYTYYFKETSAPDGFVCADGYHQILEDGKVTVANCYDVGQLKLSKTIEGVPTDEHFTFKIQLDYSTAKLQNAATLLNSVFAATWSGNSSNCVAADGETALHGSEIAFQASAENTNIYTAEVSLKNGETLTLSGIPTGTSYTVTETNSGGYTPEAGTITGTVEKESTAAFTNTKYEGTSFTLGATKTVDGAAPTADQTFTFVLEKWNSSNEEWMEVERTSNGAGGDIAFTPITVSAPQSDAYYRIRELDAGGAYVYDTAARYAKVATTSVRGVLTATVTYYSEWEETAPKSNSVLANGIVIDNAAYQSDSMYLRGEKYLDGALSEKAFTFTLYDEEGKRIESVQNDASGVFKFSAVTFTMPGTYHYEVKETAVSGYTCDKTVYKVTVEVTRDGATLTAADPIITYADSTAVGDTQDSAEVKELIPVESMIFRNTTETTTSGGTDAIWQLRGTKTLDGQPSGGFTFKLMEGEQELATVTSKSNGTITFPRQTYTKAGTHIYTVSEVAGENTSVIYDSTVYTVKVTVQRQNGKLEVTEELISVNSYTVVDAVTFANKTKTTTTEEESEELEDEDTPLGSKEFDELDESEVPLATVPRTGDVSAAWLALSALSGLGLAGASVAERKKRREE